MRKWMPRACFIYLWSGQYLSSRSMSCFVSRVFLSTHVCHNVSFPFLSKYTLTPIMRICSLVNYCNITCTQLASFLLLLIIEVCPRPSRDDESRWLLPCRCYAAALMSFAIRTNERFRIFFDQARLTQCFYLCALIIHIALQGWIL